MNVSSIQNVSETTTDDSSLTSYVTQYIKLAIGGVGLIGNVFVVVVILSASTMRKQLTNAYIINQSVIDSLIALFLILTTMFEDDGRVYRTLADDIFCKMWLTKLWLWGLFVSSTYNLLALTLERYLAVVHPIWHKTKMTRKKAAASVVFIWLFGPAYNMAYMIPTSGTTEDGHCVLYTMWPSTLWQRAVGVLTIFMQFFCPLFLLIFFYTKMVLVLRRRVAPEENANCQRPPVQTKKTDSMARARKNILKTLAMVAFTFVFCWSWNQVYFLMFNLGLSIDLTSIFYNFTVVMVFMNCCINPFIYITKYEQFQKTMKRLSSK